MVVVVVVAVDEAGKTRAELIWWSGTYRRPP